MNLQVPVTEEEWMVKMNEFSIMWNFPCCGAMDGKHVVIQCPNKSGSYFYNYKKTFSIILFAIVDANYNFIYIDVGRNGRNNDALVFSESTFNTALNKMKLNLPNTGLFVGDDAFPLRNYLLKPYSTTNRSLTVQQRVFNYRLSRARRIVENAFGILASRFRVFHKPVDLLIDTIDLLVHATCVLHNWLRQNSKSNMPYITEDVIQIESLEEGRVISGKHYEKARDVFKDIKVTSTNNYSKNAAQLRDELAEKFCTSDPVPWQWKMI